jgi:CTP synthase
MQCAVVEFARNVCGLDDANSTEFDKDTPHPVICLLDEQKTITDKGGTMRLGAQPTRLRASGRAFSCYGAENISERHRHRYEFNNEYGGAFAEKGLQVTGTSPDGALVEVVELEDHPWFVAVQYHPEFKSQPTKSHPLFHGFIQAAVARRSERPERFSERSQPSE